MDHNQIKDNLSAFYDGELNAKDRAEITSHLANCPECRQSLEECTKMTALFSSKMNSEPSDVFTGRVMARVREIDQSKRSWAFPKVWQVPLWSFGVIATTLLAINLSVGSAIDTETLLLTETNDDPLEWVVLEDKTRAEDVLGLALEEK